MRKREKLFVPQHPDKFTDQELSLFRRTTHRALGEIGMAGAGYITAIVGLVYEDIPTLGIGLGIAVYGLATGVHHGESAIDMEHTANERPQAETLPLEYHD